MALDLIGLQDEIVSDLNAQTFTQAMTAERGYNLTHVPSDVTTARAVVTLSSIDTINPLTRGQKTADVTALVGVQKQLDDSLPATVDPMVTLTEEVLDHLCFVKYGSVTGSPHAINAEVNSIFDAEMLHNTQVFIGVVEVTFKMIGF